MRDLKLMVIGLGMLALCTGCASWTQYMFLTPEALALGGTYLEYYNCQTNQWMPVQSHCLDIICDNVHVRVHTEGICTQAKIVYRGQDHIMRPRDWDTCLDNNADGGIYTAIFSVGYASSDQPTACTWTQVGTYRVVNHHLRR